MMLHSESSDNTTEPTTTEPVTGSTVGEKVKYEVGYGRPPVHTRFRPGTSGNPKGHRTGRPNAKTTIERILNEKVIIREGEKTRTISKLEAVFQAHIMKAAKGDPRSANIVLGFANQMGLLTDTESETPAVVLPEEDDAILKDFLRRSAGHAKFDPKNRLE
jgi:hypothetical protein